MTHTLSSASTTRQDFWISAVLISAFVLFCLPTALLADVWIDEYYSLATTSGNLRTTIVDSYRVEFLPPVYFSLLWAWRTVNNSVPFARVFSVLLMVVALWVVLLASRRWCPRTTAVWIMVPLIVNPHTIYAGTEIRHYSLAFVAAASLLYLFHRAFMEAGRDIRAEVAFVVTAVVGLYSYYHLGFLLVAGGGMLALNRSWRTLARYLAYMALVAIATAPQIPLIRTGFETLVHNVGGYVSPLDSFKTVAQVVISLPFGLYSFPPWLRWLVVAAVGVTCMGSVWAGRRTIGASDRSIWCTVVVLTLGFSAFAILNGQIVFPRHFGFAVVPAWFSIVCALSLTEFARKILLPLVAVATIALGSLSSYWSYSELTKGGNFRAAATYLESHEEADQPIFVLASYSEGPLRHYYRGVNTLVPVPAPVRYDEYRPDTWQIESMEEVRQIFESATASAEYFWVYTDHRPEEIVTWLDMDLNLSMFEEYLANHAEQQGPQFDLKSATIRFYKRK